MKNLLNLHLPFWSLAVLSLVLLRPSAANAYEEDTHFALTFVECRIAGLTDAEADIVSRYDQGMDDSQGTVANAGPGGLKPQEKEERLWHSIPTEVSSAAVLQRKQELWQQVLQEKNPTTQLKRLGIFFHYQQDTWAHRKHPNHDATTFTTYKTPLGHAKDFHQPDRPPFDPVCALRCLEDGLKYTRLFLTTCLHRQPNALFDSYQPAHGAHDTAWKSSHKGKYFNQLALDVSTPAHDLLTSLIRAQIDAYQSSPDPRLFAYSADQAKYADTRAAFMRVCRRFHISVSLPTTRQKLTTLTTTQLLSGNL